jgi:hypothetical protein
LKVFLINFLAKSGTSDEETPSECSSDEGHKVYNREEGTGRREQEAECNGKGTDIEHKEEAQLEEKN